MLLRAGAPWLWHILRSCAYRGESEALRKRSYAAVTRDQAGVLDLRAAGSPRKPTGCYDASSWCLREPGPPRPRRAPRRARRSSSSPPTRRAWKIISRGARSSTVNCMRFEKGARSPSTATRGRASTAGGGGAAPRSRRRLLGVPRRVPDDGRARAPRRRPAG